MHAKYRADIDGLRAIAVLSVLVSNGWIHEYIQVVCNSVSRRRAFWPFS